MKYSAFLQKFNWKALLLIGIVTAGSLSMLAGATDIAPAEPTDPVVLPTMTPSKQETADSAFAKLDIGKKGYLILADTKVLPGFEQVFASSDSDHDNKLTPAEFIPAWQAYTGIPSSPDTFQRKK
jgi:hypothetical protein